MSSEMTQLPMIAPSKGVVGKEPFPGLLDGTPYILIWHPLVQGPRHGKSRKPIANFVGFLLKGLRFLGDNTRALLQGPKPPNERPKCSAIFQRLLRKKENLPSNSADKKTVSPNFTSTNTLALLLTSSGNVQVLGHFFLHFSYGCYGFTFIFSFLKKSPNQLEVFKLHFTVGKNQLETRVDSRVVPNTPH